MRQNIYSVWISQTYQFIKYLHMYNNNKLAVCILAGRLQKRAVTLLLLLLVGLRGNMDNHNSTGATHQHHSMGATRQRHSMGVTRQRRSTGGTHQRRSTGATHQRRSTGATHQLYSMEATNLGSTQASIREASIREASTTRQLRIRTHLEVQHQQHEQEAGSSSAETYQQVLQHQLASRNCSSYNLFLFLV